MSTKEEKFYSLREAGKYAKMCRQAIYQAIKKGKLKAEMINRQWHITKTDIDDYRANKHNRQDREINGERIFDPEKDRFSIQMAAKWASVELKRPFPEQRLYYLVRTGQIRAYRTGTSWIIMREDLEKMVNEEGGYDKRYAYRKRA
jgi:excisionase family DNA binding protein